MKIYFNGWFSGFFERTNPGLHVGFFIELFEKVYSEKCFIGSFSDSNILCEFDMLLDCNSSSAVTMKSWKHSYLFSGESTLKCSKTNYTCVLWGERNRDNVVNIPLFIPYIYSNNFLDKLQEHSISNYCMPIKDVCVVVSNPKGLIRNKFLNKLEKNMHIDYAGGYKNNMNGCIPYTYNTPEFLNYISQYKFIISMENSREDTYITEKVIHGLLSKTIPVYWGSKRIYNYINKDRILALLEDNSDVEMDALIQRMMEISHDETIWRGIVNKNVFPHSSTKNDNNKLERTMDVITRDIRCLLMKGHNVNFNNTCWNHISRVYCINNPVFERDRHIMLKNTFINLQINNDYVSYISPTYKHTISDDIYNNCIKQQLVLDIRTLPMKKGELSLFLNYKAVLEDIEKNYEDGLFFIFESDIMIGKDFQKLNKFMDFIVGKKNEFDLIHMGMFDSRIWSTPNFNHATGYSSRMKYNNDNYIEDLSNDKSEFRLSRKFYTRCTDSFLWTYKGITLFLNYMRHIDNNYGTPFDYYMCNFFEKHIDFKHYWSEQEFFVQQSNLKLMESTIQ
jgi:hypothetical protein